MKVLHTVKLRLLQAAGFGPYVEVNAARKQLGEPRNWSPEQISVPGPLWTWHLLCKLGFNVVNNAMPQKAASDDASTSAIPSSLTSTWEPVVVHSSTCERRSQNAAVS